MAVTIQQLLELIDAFDWASYSEDLKGEFADVGRHIVALQGARAAAELGVNQFAFDDPFVQRHFTKHVGDSIKSIGGTTKDSVKELIRSSFAEIDGRDGGGLTATQLGDLVADKVRETFDGFEDWRADTIARTETADLYNMGNLAGYRQAGVEKVLVSDGDDDEECRKANGQTWTLEYALANRLAHPNCERDFSPILE